MIKLIVSGALLTLAVTCAQAGGLDALLKGVADVQNIVKQVQPRTGTDPATPASGSLTSQLIQGKAGRKVAIEPAWLPPYARSTLTKEFTNPLDFVQVPVHFAGTGSQATRHLIGMEGKITMLQYKHQTDDSPLLIRRHYDALLAQNGFERVIACNIPNTCPTVSAGHSLARRLDPKGSVDSNAVPDNATILIGYKADAVALIAIGKYNYAYSTFVGLVEGTMTNPSELTTWLASLTPSEPPSPEKAASNADITSTGDVVEVVSPARIQSAIAQTRGKLVVLLTSNDPNCDPCRKAQPVFAQLADKHQNQGRFVKALWSPWAAAFQHELVKSTGEGGVPIYLTFIDGKKVTQFTGNYPLEVLEKKLLTK